jgi:hypothetical protein
MKSVNDPITQQDLQRHYANLIYQEDLKALTARQLEIIALMMEDEYRKGVNESNQLRNIAVKVNLDGIGQKVREELDNKFKELADSLTDTVVINNSTRG